MSNEARHFRVGLFVLTGAVMIVGAVVLLGGKGLLAEPLLCETYFDESVQGLEVGSPVKFRGVRLGVVSDIGLVNDYYELDDPAQNLKYGQRVLVRMEIAREGPEGKGIDEQRLLQNLSVMVELGLRLRLTAQGITGLTFIEADYVANAGPSEHDFPWEPDATYVPSAPSAFKQLTSAVERVMAKLESVEIEKIILNIDAVLELMASKLADIDVREIEGQLSSLLNELRATNDTLAQTLEAGRIAELSLELQGAIGQFRGTLSAVDAAVEGGSFQLQAALENLRVAAQSLREVTESARSYPSHVLFGEKPPPSPVSNP